jgi:[acyl-carrier-protein] S-malonyltransferase
MSEVWLFPGQGSQYPGMGRALYQTYAEAREILDTAGRLAELPVAGIAMDGPREKLMQPAVLEPAIVALELSYVEELRRRGSRPDAVAGYSLGEIAALYCAEVVTLVDALAISVLRGRILQKAAIGLWRMAAASGLAAVETERIVAEIGAGQALGIAAYNAPGHLAIAGERDAVLRAEAAIAGRGGLTAPIEVAGPWHCSLAASAAIEIQQALEAFHFRPPKIPFYSSMTGALMTAANELRACLAYQICRPVLWNDVLDDLWRRGARRSLEIGPGHVLTGFVRRTWPLNQYQARFLERENGNSLAPELLRDGDPGGRGNHQASSVLA